MDNRPLSDLVMRLAWGILILASAVGFGLVGGRTDFADGQAPPTFCSATNAEAIKGGGDYSRKGVVLVTRSASVAQGAVAYARLVNFSSKEASYSVAFAIERRGSAGWAVDQSSPSGPWPKVRGRLRPESAGHCYRFDVSAEMAPGTYRFSTSNVQVRGQSPQRRTAEFKVQ